MKDDDRIICRCEEVSLKTIHMTVHQYNCSSREVKLRTRAAMGQCGGRTCRNIVDQIVADINQEDFPDNVRLSYRPPARPITFGELGGRSDEPES